MQHAKADGFARGKEAQTSTMLGTDHAASKSQSITHYQTGGPMRFQTVKTIKTSMFDKKANDEKLVV